MSTNSSRAGKMPSTVIIRLIVAVALLLVFANVITAASSLGGNRSVALISADTLPSTSFFQRSESLHLESLSTGNTASYIVCQPVVTVTSLLDSGAGSLRQAVTDVCTGGTITFGVTGIVGLTSGQIILNQDVSIQGPGANQLNISRTSATKFRIFFVENGKNVNISGVTISNGDSTVAGGGGFGAGIFSYGNLNLNAVVLTGLKGENGTAVTNVGGTFSISNSTISNNTSLNQAAGVYTYNSNPVSFTNTTISGNTCRTQGAGIFVSAPGVGPYALNITNSTITNNTAGPEGDSTGGGGISIYSATPVYGGHNAIINATLRNSIVAGNSPNNFKVDLDGGSPNAHYVSAGHNIDGDGISGFINGVNGDQVGTALSPINALLGPLGSYGGPTPTHELLAGSPAIDQGSSDVVTDQRGLTRPYDNPNIANAAGGNGSDIGAFEAQRTYVVDNASDDELLSACTDAANDCSLRGAISIAEAGATITFSVTGEIALTEREIAIERDLTIAGPGASILALDGYTPGFYAGAIFEITSGTVRISGLTLKDGQGKGLYRNGWTFYGGAIFMSGGAATVSRCVLRNNLPDNSGGAIYIVGGALSVIDSTLSNNEAGLAGGGIYATGLYTTVTITGSTISGNRAPVGGGILFAGSALTMANSTISGNWATGQPNGRGGGIIFGSSSTGTITNSTITKNIANVWDANGGGGINGGTVNMSNTIVAGNFATYYPASANTSFTVISGTNNLIVTDPMLAPLADNGGPTKTHKPLADSPALDAGDPNFSIVDTPYDQRGPGFARKVGSAIDIGAVEVQAAVTATAINTHPEDQNLCDMQAANFSVVATGVDLNYQWRREGGDLTDGGVISGANTANLTISSVGAINGGYYEVFVSGANGNATSDAAILTVNLAPAITDQPSNQAVNSGANASFTAAASGAQSVQWQISTDGGASFGDISGATAATLNLFGVTSAQNGSKYRAVFSGGCGDPATTGAATLTVSSLAQTITFDAISDKTYGDAPFALSASSTSNLPVVFSVVSGPATISGTMLTITGAGSVTVNATQSGNDDYEAAVDVPRTFAVGKAQATVTLSGLSQIYNGTARVVTAVSSPADLSVPLTYDGLSPAPINAGSYAVVATIDDANYQGGANGTLVIDPKTTSLNLSPQILAYGNSIAEAASVSGGPGGESIVYTLASGSNAVTGFGAYSNPVNAGSYTLKAVYAGNSNHAGSNATANVTINKVSQIISWSNPAAITYGTALGAAQLNATLTSGDGSLIYSPEAGTVLNAGDGQNLRVDASETTNYSATFKIVQVNVAKANQTITFDAITDKTYGDAPFALSASSTSNLPVGYSVVSGPATIDSGTLTITGAGAITIRAAQAGNAQYNTASTVDRTFNVGKAQATITLSDLIQTYNGTARSATANTTPGGLNVTLTYSQNGVPVVSPTNAGSYNVSASMNDANYEATATDTLTIAKAIPVITWINPTGIVYGTPLGATQLNATTTTAGGFVYNPAAGAVLDAGAQNLSVTFTPNAANNYETVDKSVTINVAKATQTITFSNPGTKALGTAPFNLGGSASSGLAVSYSIVSGPATVLGSTLTITGAGSVTVRASQSGNGNYNAAPDVSQTFTVNKAALLVTALNQSGTYSDALPTLSYAITGFINGDNASVVTGAPALDTTATVVNGNITSGAGSYPITASPGTLSSANYSFNFAGGVLTVNKETTVSDYTGDNYAETAGPNVSTASGVRLAGHFTQQSDGALGDLTLSKGRIELYKFSNMTSTPTYVFGNLAVSASGDVETTASLAVDDAYTVRVVVESANGYWTASSNEATLTIAPGGFEKRVSGAGSVVDAASANGKGSFGFTVNYGKSGTPKGNALYAFRGTDGFNYRVKSTSWQGGGLTFYQDPAKAAFMGKGNVQKIDPATGVVVESWGNYSFTVDLIDGDLRNPSETDRYAIQILTDAGMLWRQIGSRTSPLQIESGKISVRSK